MAARDRPKYNIPNPPPRLSDIRSQVKPEEYKAAAIGFVANFGTWSFNEATKTLTMSRDGALFPNAEGGDDIVTITGFSGVEMKASSGNGWRRVRR